MIETKVREIGKVIGLGLILASAAVSASGCGDSSSCVSPNNNQVSKVEQRLQALYSDSNTSQYKSALSAACASDNCCRDGCSYDSDKGCCWCPKD